MNRSLRGNAFLICALTALIAGTSIIARAEAPQKASPFISYLNENEDQRNAKGAFSDDSTPLIPLPTKTPFPKEPSSGACAIKKGQSSPWRRGFQDGLTGRRNGFPDQFFLSFKSELGPVPSDPRKACNQYRSTQSGSNTDFTCCNAGYREAARLLAEQIGRWIKEKEVSSLGADSAICLENYTRGMSDALKACTLLEDKKQIACNMIESTPPRYLGCFMHGFWKNMINCDAAKSEMKKARELKWRSAITDVYDVSGKRSSEGTSTAPDDVNRATGAQGGTQNP